MNQESVLSRKRPEVAAGGYARDDGIVSFYQRVNALLEPHMTVLDLGCGRGEVFDWAAGTYRAKLAKLQGKVAKVIGVDVDEGVLEHPFLDERHLLKIGDPLPLADQSVDLIVCDWVLEHIEQPGPFSAELGRVLKPGGWLCARTPNRWGYVALGARIIPKSMHSSVLGRLMPHRAEKDVFETHYAVNSLALVKRYFPSHVWNNYSYAESGVPKYFGESGTLFNLLHLYQKIAPQPLQTDLLLFLQKKV